MKVSIIGAGVVGLACATELISHGIEITIFERGAYVGADACSWWAGGMLAPWCEGENAEEPVVRLGNQAITWWRNHTNSLVENGTLVLALGRDVTELKSFARRTECHQVVDAERIKTLEPDLTGRFNRGLFFEAEAHLDPRKALKDLEKKLTERGVRFHFNAAVYDQSNLDTDLVLDCRGLAARDTFSDLRGVKGEMLLVHSTEITLNRSIRLLHPRIPLYIVPRGNGLFMIGATMIESSERERITVRSMFELLGSAYSLHPAFGEAEIVEIGVDARPAFPNNLPRLRWKGNKLGVNGMYRHGFLLAPAIARMVTAAIFDRSHIPEMMDEHCS